MRLHNDNVNREILKAKIAELAADKNMTSEEARQAIIYLGEYLKQSSWDIQRAEDYTNLHLKTLESATRPAVDETTEKPNQKSDLEIFDANSENEKPLYIFKNGSGIFTINNSDPLEITYDDDWIKQALGENK